jgi:hypothetical protein
MNQFDIIFYSNKYYHRKCLNVHLNQFYTQSKETIILMIVDLVKRKQFRMLLIGYIIIIICK